MSYSVLLMLAFLGLISGRLYRTEIPPMGWNSWNHYRFNISEKVVKETADAFVRLGLDKLGYKYINLDDGWAH